MFLQQGRVLARAKPLARAKQGLGPARGLSAPCTNTSGVSSLGRTAYSCKGCSMVTVFWVMAALLARACKQC